jgi:hypothetical protein
MDELLNDVLGSLDNDEKDVKKKSEVKLKKDEKVKEPEEDAGKKEDGSKDKDKPWQWTPPESGATVDNGNGYRRWGV